MLVSLAPLDWAVILLFVGGVLALGLSAKLRGNSVLQYLAAGRALTLPFFVATLVSTWYGGILGIGESVTYFGVGTWLLMGVPFYLFAILYALVYAKRVRQADQISIPERIEASFGRGPALAAALLVFLLGVPAAHVLMVGVLTEALTGWPLAVCVGVAVVVGGVLMVRGGLLADVRMSTLAFLMMYVGFLVACVVGFAAMPPGEVLARVAEQGEGLAKATGGAGPFTILGFFLLGAWTLIDPGFHQRVASARDPETGRRGVLVSVVCWLVFDLLSISTGLLALAKLGPDGLARLGEGPAARLLVFPAYAELALPAGLKAVFLCGMLGTILSAMVGYALVSGGAAGRDLVGRWRRETRDDRLTLASRWGIVAAFAVAVWAALGIQSVVALWYAWGGAIIGGLLIPVAASYGLLRLRARPAWVAVSMLLAFGVGFGLLLAAYAQGKSSVVVEAAGQSIDLGTMVPALLTSALVLVTGHLLWPQSKHGEPADR